MSKEDLQKELSDKKTEGFLKFLDLVLKKPAILESENVYNIAREYINGAIKKNRGTI